MSNFTFGYSALKDNKFVDYTPVASSEHASYPDDNLKIYAKTKRHWRSVVTTNVNIVCTFSGTKNIIGIFLNDVNFTAVTIGGTAFTVTKNPWTQRYNLYAVKSVTGTSVTLTIASQTPVDGAAYFRIGSIVFLDTVLTLAKNPSFPYEYGVEDNIKTNKLPSGNETDILQGGLLWKGSFGFNGMLLANVSDASTLSGLLRNQYIVFYENNGDTSMAYLCRRRSTIDVSWSKPKTVDIKTISYQEIG
jgi:hypothetical protein